MTERVSEGVLLVDKPAGMTSHDVVNFVRRALGTRKVGHAGTLDPMATGLLVLGVGRATRLLRFLSGLDKAYSGTAVLGIETDTYDAEGAVVRTAEVTSRRKDVERITRSLTGSIMQRPPAFSAVKVGGQILHRAARRGEPIEAPERRVVVHRFALTDWAPPAFAFEVECSSGTYIRSLVADLGRALGPGAHLTSLRRHRVGPFDLADARRLDDPGDPLPLERAVSHLPSVRVSADEAAAASHGRPLGPAGVEGPHAVFDPEGRLVAIYRDDGARAVPEMVLAPT